VRVTENLTVVAAATDRFGDLSPPIVCFDGIPSTAALVVLDGLVATEYKALYHGDLDWRGLTIASVLARKIPRAEPWQFGALDYLAAVRRGLGTVGLAASPVPSPWDRQLALALQRYGVAGYKEQVISDLLGHIAGELLGDLASEPA